MTDAESAKLAGALVVSIAESEHGARPKCSAGRSQSGMLAVIDKAQAKEDEVAFWPGFHKAGGFSFALPWRIASR